MDDEVKTVDDEVKTVDDVTDLPPPLPIYSAKILDDEDNVDDDIVPDMSMSTSKMKPHIKSLVSSKDFQKNLTYLTGAKEANITDAPQSMSLLSRITKKFSKSVVVDLPRSPTAPRDGLVPGYEIPISPKKLNTLKGLKVKIPTLLDQTNGIFTYVAEDKTTRSEEIYGFFKIKAVVKVGTNLPIDDYLPEISDQIEVCNVDFPADNGKMSERDRQAHKNGILRAIAFIETSYKENRNLMICGDHKLVKTIWHEVLKNRIGFYPKYHDQTIDKVLDEFSINKIVQWVAGPSSKVTDKSKTKPPNKFLFV